MFRDFFHLTWKYKVNEDNKNDSESHIIESLIMCFAALYSVDVWKHIWILNYLHLQKNQNKILYFYVYAVLSSEFQFLSTQKDFCYMPHFLDNLFALKTRFSKFIKGWSDIKTFYSPCTYNTFWCCKLIALFVSLRANQQSSKWLYT